MTESEAKTLRDNGAELYRHMQIAFYVAVSYSLQKAGSININDRDQVQALARYLWDKSGIDDTFHTLSSQGYRSLIQSGWNPYVVNDPNDWQPSPDCIDNPTTRGGMS